jgi:diguanylate cyclase (GGDEF)-like protein
MKRASALRTRWYLATGAVLTFVCLVAPWHMARQVAYLIAAAQLVPVVLLAARAHRISTPVTVLACMMGVFYAGAQATSASDTQFTSVVPGTLGLLGSTSMIVGLVVLLRQRPFKGREGVIGDALIVGLGSWIINWVAFVHPLIRGRTHTVPATVLYGVYQPAASIVLFLVAVLLFGQAKRPTSLWLLAGGLVLNLFGDLTYALMDARHIADAFDRVGMTFYVAAYFVGGAAFVHPSAVLLTHRRGVDQSPRRLGRLIITTSSLVFPIVVLAATGPDGRLDQMVRSISALVLAGAVTLRVAQSVRSNGAAQDELLKGAQTDPLTGLPNRNVLLERINSCLSDSWHHDRQPALYFVDLDRFKNINDSLGHSAGDEVLIMVAQRLRNAVPEDATVARLSGDEYVVLEPGAKNQAASMALADRLLAVFREPLALTQGDVFVTASIGMAHMSPSSSSSAEDLIRHADTAMYRAKDSGRNCMALYDESMHERVAHRLAVETALYRALDRRELRLFHQPILDLESGDVEGFEALMRWQRADGTIVSPAEFIPIAEDTGTIVPIGSWALLEALSQLRTWIDDAVRR